MIDSLRARTLKVPEAMMTLQTGTRIAPNLELVQPVAEGGMGSIWVAENTILRRQVAIKVLTESLAQMPEAQDRFTLEAQAVAGIRSRFIPQVFDYGKTADGTPYIVMELLDGVDLHTHIHECGVCSTAHTLRIVEHVGAALVAAHAKGIIHRDIKPENIMLVPTDGGEFTAKLLDFGIAKLAPENDSSDHDRDRDSDSESEKAQRAELQGTLGTPGYISPEQLADPEAVDARSDLWSLAVVTYVCLTGQLPFAGATFGAVCFALDRGLFVDATLLNSALPPAIDPWFHKALHRDPERRFSSVQRMVSALARALDVPRLPPPREREDSQTNRQTKPVFPRARRASFLPVGIVATVIGVLAGAAIARFEPDWQAQVARWGVQIVPIEAIRSAPIHLPLAR